MTTYHLTTAQALVKFLDSQYVISNGKEIKFIEHMFAIFGHGNVVGLGEALEDENHGIQVIQGRNEQGMCHAAIGYAKQWNRKKIIPCTSSVGPGAANMVTAAATATVNHIPLLLFPGDTFATRRPDPVLQQVECESDLTITTNDIFKPVCKYFDRVTRPEQLMTAMLNAMRVLTDPKETGAVCISIPQDTGGEVYDYPDYFFVKRLHRICRPFPDLNELEDAVEQISKSKRPLVIVGGGVKYSEAGEDIIKLCEMFHIPFAETQAGKSACPSSNSYCLGGIGTTGTLAANLLAKSTDCIIAVGTRLTDFTTASKWQFQNPNCKIISINISRYHASKMDAFSVVGDARQSLRLVIEKLKTLNYKSEYGCEIKKVKSLWDEEMKRLSSYSYDVNFQPIIKALNPKTIEDFIKTTGGTLTQTGAIAAIRKNIPDDAIIVTAGGSLPSCLQRMWTTDSIGGYHAEYGYSCMGYECAASLGVKMAEANKEVYAFVGDGSFQMLHSEMATCIQEGIKINILVFDNCGFGCINNLQMTHGMDSFVTEFRYRDSSNKLAGKMIGVDYAKIAEAYGFKSFTAHNREELLEALKQVQISDKATLIDIKVLPKTMTDGYETWWDVGIAEVSNKKSVEECFKNKILPNRLDSRKY